MSTSRSSRPPESGWWLCSHLVSLAILGAANTPASALLEEISATGVRFACDERIREGTELRIGANGFEVQTTVIDCRVREDDFCVEARFERAFQWNPGVWKPDHLYRPPARRAKAAGTS